MKKQAYVFPETVPSMDVLFPLVQVFSPVVYIQPVENELEMIDASGSCCHELIEGGFCRFDSPAPLGEDRERFLRLVGELRTRQDDYAAQLAHLTLAGMAGSERTGEESGSSIVRRLLHSQGIETNSGRRLDMVLWQARLVLKLGELYDEEQRALERELEKITNREEALFTNLSRESPDTFSLTRSLAGAERQIDSQRPLRLKAWSRLLFLAQERGKHPEGEIFVTADRDALERLSEEFESIPGRNVEKVCSVLLPTTHGESSSCSLDRILRFREAAAPHVAVLERALSGKGGTVVERGQFADPDGEWGVLLEQEYPAASFSRSYLGIYLFPGKAAPALFLGAFGAETDLELLEGTEQESDSGTIIGLLADG